jgi:hypothetical protein
MGCYDVFCIICGNPYHSVYSNNIKELKELKKQSKWMDKCSMLLINDQVIHNVTEVACNITFCNKSRKLCAEHIDKNINLLKNCSFMDDTKYGIFIHTDCWKYIKKSYKIELKYSYLPKIININYGDIENYWEQEFNFQGILNDNKQYLCSSPLKNDKNINQIKKNINSLKIKNDPNRVGPSISATFYDPGDIRIGKNKKFWIIRNNRWQEINDNVIKIKLDINITKISKKKENYLKKIPFIGQYNTIPIFISSYKKINKNIYHLELLLNESYKEKIPFDI